MNREAFMFLDRLEKLMCSPQSQHPSNPFLAPVASMSRGWKGTLLKFGGEVGEGRVHLEDTFSVPLGSFQSGWPTSPTLWPGSLSIRVPSVCALAGPPWPRLSLWIFLRCAYREACGGASLNVLLLLLIRVTQDSVELSDCPFPPHPTDLRDFQTCASFHRFQTELETFLVTLNQRLSLCVLGFSGPVLGENI